MDSETLWGALFNSEHHHARVAQRPLDRLGTGRWGLRFSGKSIDKIYNMHKNENMNIVVAILAFVFGGYVAKAMETMTPEQMEVLESKKNEVRK